MLQRAGQTLRPTPQAGFFATKPSYSPPHPDALSRKCERESVALREMTTLDGLIRPTPRAIAPKE
jgi:hypothetical protein